MVRLNYDCLLQIQEYITDCQDYVNFCLGVGLEPDRKHDRLNFNTIYKYKFYEPEWESFMDEMATTIPPEVWLEIACYDFTQDFYEQYKEFIHTYFGSGFYY